MQIQRHLKVKQMHLGHTERSKVMQAGLGHAPRDDLLMDIHPPGPPYDYLNERLTNAIASSDLNRNYRLILLAIILHSSSCSWRGDCPGGT